MGKVEFEDAVLKGWWVIYTGFKKKAQAGVGIILAPHVQLEDVIPVKEGRIIGAQVVLNGTKLSILSCYSPTDKSYSDQTKDEFYNSLSKAISSTK